MLPLCLTGYLQLGEVGTGGQAELVDLSREGGVGGRELGRDMFEEGRAGLRKRVGGKGVAWQQRLMLVGG